MYTVMFAQINTPHQFCSGEAGRALCTCTQRTEELESEHIHHAHIYLSYSVLDLR